MNLPDSGEFERKPEPYVPSPVDRFLVQRVNSRMDPTVAQPNRWALERIWFENVLFYLGEQWLDWNANSKTWKPLDAPRWFPKPVTNEVFPRAERLVAQYLKSPAVSRVRPNTNEPEDKEGAKAGEQLLAHSDDVVMEELLRHEAAACLTLCGTVISEERFNPNAGPIVEIPRMNVVEQPVMEEAATCPSCMEQFDAGLQASVCPSCGQANLMPTHYQATLSDGSLAFEPVQQPVIGEDGQPIIDRFFMGEIESEIHFPFSFHVDPNASSLRKAQWAGHVAFKPMEWIRQNFPDKAKYVTPDNGVAAGSYYQDALLQLVGRQQGGPGGKSAKLADGAVIKSYEEMPSPDFPEGLKLIVCGDVLLWEGPLPLETELSYSECVYSPVLGRFWGTTPIEQITALNRRLNGIDSQITINTKTILNPWMLVPKGSGIQAGGIYLRPAAVVEWSPMGAGGATPQIVPGTPLPAQIFEQRTVILDAIERICATQDVLRGDVPAGVKSGVALNFLGEAAETTHMPRARRWEQFFAQRGRKRLLLMKKFYKEPRMVKVLGAGSTWQVRQLSGADLRDNVDVTVEAGSSLPRSRTAQIQLILDSLKEGILGDPRVDVVLRQKLLEDLGLIGYDTDVGPDFKRALAENAMMDDGVMPEVTLYENLEVHHAVHLREIREPRFDDKPPAAKRAYLMHLQETRAKWIEEQQRELAARLRAQAGGDDPNADGGGEGGDVGGEGAAPSAEQPPPTGP